MSKTTCTLSLTEIFTKARSLEGMAELKNKYGIKGRLSVEKLQEANPGVTFKGVTAAANAMEKASTKTKTPKKTKSSTKTKASGKSDASKVANKAKGKTKAPATQKPAVPAGYRMLLKAIEAGTNLSDTLLVGAYKDVQTLLVEASIPVSSVKGVYLMDDDTIAAHIYVRGKDGAQTMDDDDFCIEIAEALGAETTELYVDAPRAEGSKAKNFVAYAIENIDASDYDTLSVDAIA